MNSAVAGLQHRLSGRNRRLWSMIWTLVSTVTVVTSVSGEVLVISGTETEIVTQGPWERRGDRVIYTSDRGVLSSLRVSDVDLELSLLASARLQLHSVADQELPVASDRAPTMKITNADLGRVNADEHESAGRLGASFRESAESSQTTSSGGCAIELTLRQPMLTGFDVVIDGTVVPKPGCYRVVSLHWRWGDGHESGSWFPAVHRYADSGSFSVEVTAFDEHGSRSHRSLVVEISE